MKISVQLPILTILLTLVSVMSCNAQIQRDVRSKRSIEVIFNNKLNAKDLDNIRHELWQYGIILNYDSREFDKKDRLMSLKFNVDCKDGFSGSAEKSGLTKDSRFGFFRDYFADATYAKPAFGTGEIE